jgi:predicted lipase
MPSPAFDIQEALQLGQFVQAAYDLFQSGDPPDFTPPAGYTLVTKVYADDITDGIPDYMVFGYIARSASPNSDVIVAIRGTEGILEWIMDFRFLQTNFPYVNGAGKTEKGFTYFYSTFHTGPDNTHPRVVEAIRALMSDGTVATLRITGHSLGAALATLLAIDVAGNQVFATPSVYTFASPKVGDKVFAGSFDNFVTDSWRISNRNDLVPQLPFFTGYVHVDAEYPINSDDSTKFSLPCWHSLRTYLHTLDNSQPLDSVCEP